MNDNKLKLTLGGSKWNQSKKMFTLHKETTKRLVMKNADNEFPYKYRYWRPAVAADNVVFRFDGKNLLVLLIKRKNEPFKGQWAFPGGFMEQGETLDQTALRELKEETDIEPVYTNELCVCSDPNRDPRGQTVSAIFYSFVKKDVVSVAADDAVELDWFDIYELPDLAFDHTEVMQKAISTMRHKIKFDPSFFHLLDDHFTLSELCRLWSCVFNRKFDRRNFQKHWTTFSLLTSIITPVAEHNNVKKTARSPKYYQYNHDAYLQFLKKNSFKF